MVTATASFQNGFSPIDQMGKMLPSVGTMLSEKARDISGKVNGFVNTHLKNNQVSHIGSGIFSDAAQLFAASLEVSDGLLGIARSVSSMGQKVLNSGKLKLPLKLLHSTRLLAITALPMAVYEFVVHGIGLGKATFVDKKIGEVANEGLYFAAAISAVTGSVAEFADGLAHAGMVSFEALGWVPVFHGLFAAFSVANIVLNVKGIVQILKMRKEIDGESTEPSKKDDIFKELGVNKSNREKLEKEENKGVFSKISSTLKGRINHKIVSSCVAIVSTAVVIVAIAIFSFTPLAVVGYSLLIGASVLGLAKFTYDRVMDYRLNKIVKENLVKAKDS